MASLISDWNVRFPPWMYSIILSQQMMYLQILMGINVASCHDSSFLITFFCNIIVKNKALNLAVFVVAVAWYSCFLSKFRKNRYFTYNVCICTVIMSAIFPERAVQAGTFYTSAPSLAFRWYNPINIIILYHDTVYLQCLYIRECIEV
jgi:hypothetical protein